MFRDSYKGTGRRFDKVRSPEETLEWVFDRFHGFGRPLLHSLKRMDRGRLGIPVYVSRYEPAAGLVTGSTKQMGKGVTEAQAKASAVMELVERFSLFEFARNGNFNVLPFVSVEEPKFSLEHLLISIHCRPEYSGHIMTLLEGFLHQWAKGFNLSEETESKIPFSWIWPINRYNGSAAGNSIEEAAVQAICEVVERHVCSVITYSRARTPLIELDHIEDEELSGLIDRFRDNGIELVLKDFSLNMGIPTVGAIAWDPSTFPERSEIVYTAGTSTSPERAAVRALTEIAQLAGDFDTDADTWKAACQSSPASQTHHMCLMQPLR